ncbi:SURF1 family protein [uncultured Sphingomonas sp.]|mgnify:CR=1 FL=1|uniref:SURF1 family protein n=1 Tax=uncultured Sphingomonas sp. TaxID=158754 RepID=UPI0026362A64|nr:SURF1 family protein [uncultured Sphingomonas sp.]
MRSLIAKLLVAAGVLGFLSLGVWQIERLQWKRALIRQVDAKLAAAPVPAPPAAYRATAADSYTRVTARGRWLSGHDAYVQAVTALGGGYWVMTPLDTPGGRIIVNRGFVPTDMRGRAPAASGAASVTGLLRLTEPGGGFLRANDPAAGRWYSRDVAGIAAARGLGPVAPWFIDAGANGDGWPRGGLTIVSFRNSHLSYALTWFAMAALLAWLGWRAWRKGAQ